MEMTLTCSKCNDTLYSGVVPECFEPEDNLMCQMCAFNYTMEGAN